MPVSAEKTSVRDLPERKNPCLLNPPTVQELIENRRLGQTNLGDKNGGSPFSYVHLRVSLPQPLEQQELFGTGPRESYFLMRRSKDGFISSTGMFKATFPWARKAEEEAEKKFVKSHFKKTSKEETAGNLWIDPVDALTLADGYGIRPWIEALLSNDPVLPSDHRKRSSITPPPPFFHGVDSESVSITSPGPALSRRSTRSTSPGKRALTVTPRKSRASKTSSAKETPLKKKVTPILEAEEITTVTTTEEITLTPTSLPNGTGLSATTPVKKQVTAIVEVDEEVKISGDTEMKTTHLKVEMPQTAGEPPSPESTAEMIARAREMVAEAVKIEGDFSSPVKRKAVEIVEGEDESKYEDEESSEQRKAKKSKFLDAELRREKIKSRALLGLTATLAIGALLPYVL